LVPAFAFTAVLRIFIKEQTENALLHIPRRNIRICLISGKRVFSTLMDNLLTDWDNLIPLPGESKSSLQKRKESRRLQWEQLVVTKEGHPKPIKLDGMHVRSLIQDGNWQVGVSIMDREPKTKVLWEVTEEELSKYSALEISSEEAFHKRYPPWRASK